MNLSRAAKVTRVGNAEVAGQGDINSSSVDTKSLESVQFMALLGSITATAVVSLKAQQSSDNGIADDWTDLAGTGVSVPDSASNGIAILDISSPRKRFVRAVISRGVANAAIDGIIALQYEAQVSPVEHDSSVAGSGFVHAPAEV